MRDRLWFFTAGRYVTSPSQHAPAADGHRRHLDDTNKRGEIKLTGTVATHTIQGGYLNNPRTTTNDSGILSFIIDPHTAGHPLNPNHYYFTNYRGLFGRRSSREAQYSQRKFRFDDGGASQPPTVLAVRLGDPVCLHLQCAPYFDRPIPKGATTSRSRPTSVVLDRRGPPRHQGRVRVLPQPARGRQLAVVDRLCVLRRFSAGREGPAGARRQRRLFPIFVPGESFVEFYPAVRGATLNVDNHSFFIQDHWVQRPPVGRSWRALRAGQRRIDR